MSGVGDSGRWSVEAHNWGSNLQSFPHINLGSFHHGPLASTRLDLDFHVWTDLRWLSAALFAGVRVGTTALDFLKNLAGRRSWNQINSN